MATVSDRASRIAALGFDYGAQPREGISACNLCGARRFVVLTHRDRYGYAAEAHACAACGLVFINPRMTADAYAGFYSGVYRPLVSAFHGRLINAQTIQAEQRDYAAQCAGFIRPFISGATCKTMLDIGGSTGVIAHHFAREFGVHGTVIDPAPPEVEEARRAGLETVTGLVERHDFSARQFDLVIICQTIDHLLDIAGVLARVRDLLPAHGLLFVDIVDFRAAYLRNWSVEDAVKIDHPFYLTESTMATYLARAGFDVLRSSYAGDHLHIGYVCRPSEPRSDAMPPAANVDAMLREIRYVQNAPRA